MENESKPLLCPLMDGRPCVGKDCACALVTFDDRNKKSWYTCGLTHPRDEEDGRQIVCMEDMDG